MSIWLCVTSFLVGYALVTIGLAGGYPMATTVGVFLMLVAVVAGVVRSGVLPEIGIDRSEMAPGHLCPSCGYDLRGVSRRICPECGSAFTIRQENAHLLDPAGPPPRVHSGACPR